MTIAYRCTCGEPLRAQNAMAGQQARCPNCHEMHTVPTETSRRRKRRREESVTPSRQWIWFLGGAGLGGVLLVVALLVWRANDGGATPDQARGKDQVAPIPLAWKAKGAGKQQNQLADPGQRDSKPIQKNDGLPKQREKRPQNAANGGKQNASAKDSVPAAKGETKKPLTELYTYRPGFRVGTPSHNVRIVQEKIDSLRLEAVGANAVIGYGREGPAFPVDDMKPTRMTLNPGDKGIRLDGRLGGTVYFGALMPGSTGLQVLIDRQVGYTTTLGLRFQDPATLSLPADGSVQVDRPGVRARDKDGVPYVSREVKVGGRMVIAMVKGDGPAVRLPEPGQNKLEKTPNPDRGEGEPKGLPEKEPAAEPMQPIAETRHFEGHTATVWSVAFSPKGRRVLSGSADRTIRLWEVKTGKCLRVFEGVTAPVKSVVFAPSGKQALSGGEDGSVVLWDVETGKPAQRFEGHTGAVLCVAFAPNGTHVVSAGADHTLRLWDVAKGEEVRRFEGHKGPVQAVAFSPNGLWLVSRSQDGTVRRWEMRTGKEFKSFPGQDASGGQVCAFDGRRVLSSVADKDLRLWDAESGKELRRFHGHTGRIGAVALSLADRRALSGGADLLLRLWDLETGKELQQFTGHTKEVTSIAIANDGRHALSGGADNIVRLWDLPRATGAVAGTKRPEGKEIDFYYWNPRHKVNGISKNLQVFERQAGDLDVTLLPKGVLIAVRQPNGREIGLPDALGSTNIRVKVNPRLGYTTLAGLRFKSNVTVNIGQDGAVYVNRVGIRAIDDMTDDVYISRQVTHGGRRVIVMVLFKRAM